MTVTTLTGDCRDILPTLPTESVQCVVTSPPYFGLRDYGTGQWDGGDADCDHVHTANLKRDASGGVGGGRIHGTRGEQPSSTSSVIKYREVCGKCGATRQDRQIGLESTVTEYVAELVAVFREVRRVLRPDGVLWLNLGSSYGDGKQLIPVPWLMALALQADAWVLRQDIIWSKPNAMPESVTDRCTKSHEYLFLLTKSARYFYDAAAIAEPAMQPVGVARLTAQHKRGHLQDLASSTLGTNAGSPERNKRSVWTIATQPYADAHFATFPEALVEPCILAGSRAGDMILDPFGGSGTTGRVAERLGRDSILVELNPAYVGMIERRTAQRGMVLA